MTEKTLTTAKHSGMGAIPTSGRVTFRVWAPHAAKVCVIGSFNDWNDTATPLASEQNGYWSIDVPDAKKGDEYRYLIHGPAGPLSRIDPYVRKVTNAAGNGIIYETQAFDWGEWSDKTFPMATGNELVIYEMHIGTFNVKQRLLQLRPQFCQSSHH